MPHIFDGCDTIPAMSVESGMNALKQERLKMAGRRDSLLDFRVALRQELARVFGIWLNERDPVTSKLFFTATNVPNVPWGVLVTSFGGATLSITITEEGSFCLTSSLSGTLVFDAITEPVPQAADAGSLMLWQQTVGTPLEGYLAEFIESVARVT
jgi:hypothetical protein